MFFCSPFSPCTKRRGIEAKKKYYLLRNKQEKNPHHPKYSRLPMQESLKNNLDNMDNFFGVT
jgi:hypothetical protein